MLLYFIACVDLYFGLKRLLFTAFILVSLLADVEVFADENVTDTDSCKEPNWPCPTNTYYKCLSKEKVCDKKQDCLDGVDETTAACASVGKPPPVCNSNTEFQCQNGRCILFEQRCNKVNDCGDGSDESPNLCNAPAKPCDLSSNFKCSNGNCIEKKLTCDDKDDCGDNADENRMGAAQCQTKGFCHHQVHYRCKNNNCVTDLSKVCDGYECSRKLKIDLAFKMLSSARIELIPHALQLLPSTKVRSHLFRFTNPFKIY